MIVGLYVQQWFKITIKKYSYDKLRKEILTRRYLKIKKIGCPYKIVSAVRKSGAGVAFFKNGTLTKLKDIINEGRPIILLVRTGTVKWHYIVVIGYKKTKFLIADPAENGLIWIHKDKLYNSWLYEYRLNGTRPGNTIKRQAWNIIKKRVSKKVRPCSYIT